MKIQPNQHLRRATAATCATAMLLLLAACAKPPVVQEITPTPVAALYPVTDSLAVKNEFIGRVMPDQSVSVFVKMQGEVIYAPFAVGDTVRAGQTMLQVDGASVYAQVNQAKASYNAAKVNAEQALGTSYDSKLLTLESQVNSARARFDTASRNVRDYTDENGGAVYGYDPIYRNLRAEKTVALEAYNAAQAAYDLAKNGSYEEAIKASDAGLAQADAAYKAVAQNISNLTVSAPISGVIEAKNFDLHDMASQQTPAYVISNKDVMTVTFHVPASAVPAMALGDQIDIDNNGTAYIGEIVEVGSIADEQSGLFPVKARIHGDIKALLSGISVKVTASARKAEDVMLLPVSSLTNENGRQFVYVISPDNHAIKTAVEIGISDDERVEIVSGLTGTERIVATWSPDLADGTLLEVTKETPRVASANEGDDVKPEAEEKKTGDAKPSTEAPAANTASPQINPKLATSQTAPVTTGNSAQNKPAQSAQSKPTQNESKDEQDDDGSLNFTSDDIVIINNNDSSEAAVESTGPIPASERESLVDKAGDNDPPPPIVAEEIQLGDENTSGGK